MTKSKKLAYGLWCLGGLFGLHHVYLGRDKQAIIWLGTLGGFLFGLIRDLFKMGEYVKVANRDAKVLAKIQKERTKLLTPSLSFLRFLCAVVVSSMYGYFTVNAVSDEIEGSSAAHLGALVKLTHPLVIAMFVKIAATEVPYKCKFRWPLLGAYLGFIINLARGSTSCLTVAVISALFLNWKVTWNEKYVSGQKSKKSLALRIIRHLIRAGTMITAFLLFIWNYAFGTDVYGRRMSLKRAITTLTNACKMIEMNEMDDLCRVFFCPWHPNNYYDPNIRAQVRVFFMNIQDACRLMSYYR